MGVAMYRCREKVVRYDQWASKPYKVGAYRFEYPQVADVFAYCFRHYGQKIAEEVANKLEAMLATTLKKFVKDKVAGEVKDYLLDKVKEKLGVPSLPGPLGIAQKIIDCAVEVGGHTYIKNAVQNHKTGKMYWCNEYSPSSSLDEYVYFVLYSWVIDPENGPYYTTILPGSRPL